MAVPSPTGSHVCPHLINGYDPGTAPILFLGPPLLSQRPHGLPGPTDFFDPVIDCTSLYTQHSADGCYAAAPVVHGHRLRLQPLRLVGVFRPQCEVVQALPAPVRLLSRQNAHIGEASWTRNWDTASLPDMPAQMVRQTHHERAGSGASLGALAIPTSPENTEVRIFPRRFENTELRPCPHSPRLVIGYSGYDATGL